MNYSEAMWSALAASLPSLAPSDRAGIVSDAIALFNATAVPAAVLVAVLSQLASESAFAVWKLACGGLTQLVAMATGHASGCDRPLRSFVASLLADVVSRVGWQPVEGEGHTDAMLRVEVLAALMAVVDADATAPVLRGAGAGKGEGGSEGEDKGKHGAGGGVVAAALSRFEAVVGKGLAAVPADVLEVVLSAGVAYTGRRGEAGRATRGGGAGSSLCMAVDLCGVESVACTYLLVVYWFWFGSIFVFLKVHSCTCATSSHNHCAPGCGMSQPWCRL